jgi:hypothetical protein
MVGWGFTSTKTEWEQEKVAKVRSCLQVCCHLLTPPPLLFIGQGTSERTPHAPQERDQEPARGSPGSTNLRSVRVILGLADPQWAPSTCAFSEWLRGGSWGWFLVYMCVWGGLVALVGHRIHVMHTWWFLIRRCSLSWIDDVIDPGDACMAAPHCLSLKCQDHGGVISHHCLC